MNILSSFTCEVIIKVQLAVLTINGFCLKTHKQTWENKKYSLDINFDPNFSW